MKRKLILLTLVVAVIADHLPAQEIQIQHVQITIGNQAELVITGENLSTDVTALQFNLSLPEGITLDETAITKGAAIIGHELHVNALSNGKFLFVIYDMNLNTIGNGELLHLPITISGKAVSSNALLSTIHLASKKAASAASEDAIATITIIDPATIIDTKTSSIRKEKGWYQLNGQHIDTKNIRRGIYIHNNKPILVK